MYGYQTSDNIQELQISGGIPEIMQAVLYADERSAPFTSILAEKLRGETDIETFYNIWKFARQNVRYKTDNPGHEIVKSPGNLLSTKTGDCKSFAVFVGSILQNLGYNYFYRLIWERPWLPNQAHVYIMAETTGGELIAVDPVNPEFSAEPFYFFVAKRDYKPAKVPAISGMAKNNTQTIIFIILAGIILNKVYDKN